MPNWLNEQQFFSAVLVRLQHKYQINLKALLLLYADTIELLILYAQQNILRTIPLYQIKRLKDGPYAHRALVNLTARFLYQELVDDRKG